jgi:hypothetical protein
MFEPTSRYFALKDLQFNMPGRQHQIPYKERRFLPSADNIQVFQEIAFSAGDRLDLIAFRTLGDPEHFWRICDADNNTMHPLEMTSEPGRIIHIPILSG